VTSGEGELPRGWAWSTVGEIATEVRSGFASGKHNAAGDGIPHIRPMNVSRTGEIDLEVIKYVAREVDDRRLQIGDVVFNNTNSPALVGKTAEMRTGGDFAFSNHMTRVRLMPGVVPGFVAHQLHYLWMSGRLAPYINNHVNQASIAAKVLASQVPLAVAPTQEQERVVALVDENLSRLDVAGAGLTRAQVQLAALRPSALSSALGVDSAPDLNDASPGDYLAAGWRWERASDACVSVASGSTPSAALMSPGQGDVPFIKVYNIGFEGELDFSVKPTFVPRSTHEGQLRRSRLYPGDVLTNIVGPPLGKVAVVPAELPEWNMNQAVAAFRPGPALLSPFLAYLLQSRVVMDPLFRTGKATAGQRNLSITNCRRLWLPIPPIEVQRSLVGELGRVDDALRRSRGDAAEAEYRSGALRRSILAAAFSGRLVAQDPSDEPARVLLARIAEERSSATTQLKYTAKSSTRVKESSS
jgi:type I restriction enzyme S subunit